MMQCHRSAYAVYPSLLPPRGTNENGGGSGYTTVTSPLSISSIRPQYGQVSFFPVSVPQLDRQNVTTAATGPIVEHIVDRRGTR